MVINRLLCGGAAASRWCAREQAFHNRPSRGLGISCSLRKDFAQSAAAMSVEASKELAGRTAVNNHISGDTRFIIQNGTTIDQSNLSEWLELVVEARLSMPSNASLRESKRKVCTSGMN